MRATLGGSDQCDGGTILADNANIASRPAVFDDDYSYSSTGIFAPGNYFGYQFASPVDVLEIRVFLLNYDGYGIPDSLTFQYSDNGTDWTTAKTIASIEWDYGMYVADRLFDISPDTISAQLPAAFNISIIPQTGTIALPANYAIPYLFNVSIYLESGTAEILRIAKSSFSALSGIAVNADIAALTTCSAFDELSIISGISTKKQLEIKSSFDSIAENNLIMNTRMAVESKNSLGLKTELQAYNTAIAHFSAKTDLRLPAHTIINKIS